ncbi:peptidoglycan DD-metalloendopeptidase family protein [Paenibacillus terrigena]|uniref:peptidoglycan DD-metalloendopeptidase family protein n=1 Tax=Paenibacillus terrigena TaxID=369333 RepID=UPI0003684594|nr:peptidoglycan DD-metalloendopeptidase family protein [Paenibacillus terrigena]
MSDVNEKSRFTLPAWLKRPKKQLIIAVGSLFFVGVAAFAGNQYVTANTVEYYKVYMNGKEVGSVNNKALVNQLVALKTKEAKKDYPNVHMSLNADQISYSTTKEYKPTVDNNETLAKLGKLLVPTATGVALEINGKVVGTVKDQDTADAILAKVKSQYEPAAKAPAKQVRTLSVSASPANNVKTPMKRLESIGFKEEVETVPVKSDPSKILSEKEAYQLLTKGEIAPITYKVKEGDTISGIAHKYGVTQGVIYKNNPTVDEFTLKIGQEIDLTVTKPAVTVATVEKVTENIVIEPQTIIQKDPKMRAGESKVIRQGKPGLKQMSYMLTKHNGDLVIEQWLGQKVITAAIPEIIVRGTKVVIGEGSGNFAYPVSGASLSSPYGKRWGRIHKGVDLTSSNHNIKSADDGVVTFAGTKSGYGNVIIIDHKNGYQTLYGHLSSIKVKKGAVVEKGQLIGIMGNTGRSTGTHLHFEIHKNGSLRNPLSYL